MESSTMTGHNHSLSKRKQRHCFIFFKHMLVHMCEGLQLPATM